MLATAKTKPVGKTGQFRSRAQAADRHVGARMRERRNMLGLTQQQIADHLGVSLQQTHKYEMGINCITAGRLYLIAQALDVDVNYFFEGMDTVRDFKPTRQQQMLIDLTRDFISLPSREQQDSVYGLARALAEDKDLTKPRNPS